MQRTYARGRHRRWMLAMTMATLGWGTWWVALLLHHFAPRLRLGLEWPGGVSLVFALLGLLQVLLAVRAKRSWMLLTLIPLFANASLLLVPWLVEELFRR